MDDPCNDTPPGEPVSPEIHASDLRADEQSRRLGRYVVLHPLGEGGMGRVFAAYDPHLARRVALKVLRARPGNDPVRGRERLLKEAQSLARLAHPNIVAVHDVGLVDDELFIAVDLIDGQTLRRWAQQRRRVRAILDVFEQAAQALEAAHARGIVHRDFKADNALIDASGRLRVVDFGLAEAWSPDSRSDPGQSERRGTPAYMAPELDEGFSATPASDQYAYAVSLYEVLYGCLPFTAAGTSLRVPAGARRVPRWLRRLVLRGLSKQPQDRYASMSELLAELRRSRARGRRPLVVTSGVGAVVAALAIGVLTTDRRLILAQSDCAVLTAPEAWRAPALRAEIHEAFVRTERTHAEATVERVFAGLDRYARSWRDVARRQCSDGIPPDQQTCLRQRRAEMDALLGLFLRADAGIADHGVVAIEGLPPAASCQTAEPPSGDAAFPVAEALAHNLVGQHARAAALLASEAHAATRMPARALFELGTAYEGLERDREAADAFLRAAIEAERQRDLPLLADARAALVTVTADPLWVRMSEVSIELLGDDAERRANLAQRQAELADLQGAPLQRLVEQRQRAVTLAEQRNPPLPQAVAPMLRDLAIALARNGRHEEAERALARAQAEAELGFGPRHPQTIALISSAGILADARGDFAAALRQHERAFAELMSDVGAAHDLSMLALTRIGRTSLRRGDLRRAEHEARRVLEVLASSPIRSDPDLAQAHVDLALALERAGRYDEALGHQRQAVALWGGSSRHELRTACADAAVYRLIAALGRPLPAAPSGRAEARDEHCATW